MSPDAKPLTEAQRKALCQMMYHAFVEIRALGPGGTAQATALADAFQNLPADLWRSDFSLSFFRDAFLTDYQNKYPPGRAFDYVAMVDEIMVMDVCEASGQRVAEE